MIFISFVHEDYEVAQALKWVLSSELRDDVEFDVDRDDVIQVAYRDEVPIFLAADQTQMHAGEIWLDRVRRELESATIVLLMLSARSLKRPWVHFEAGGAWLASKVIIPVCFGNLRKDLLPKPYSDMHAVTLQEDRDYLVRSVAHHLKFRKDFFMDPSDDKMQTTERAVSLLNEALKSFRDEAYSGSKDRGRV